MGQRTCIIVQKHEKTNTGTNIETRVFYELWGTGRIMPSGLMGILLGTLGRYVAKSGFLQELRPCDTDDITDCYEMDELNALDFNAPEVIGEVIRNDGDNNNGGIFIRFTIGDYEMKSIEYAYMLGREEKGDYKSFCSEKEWMDKAGGPVVDHDFKTLYRQTISYCGAKEWQSPKVLILNNYKDYFVFKGNDSLQESCDGFKLGEVVYDQCGEIGVIGAFYNDSAARLNSNGVTQTSELTKCPYETAIEEVKTWNKIN